MTFRYTHSLGIGTLMAACFAGGYAVAWRGSSKPQMLYVSVEVQAPQLAAPAPSFCHDMGSGRKSPPTSLRPNPLFAAIRQVESGGDDFAVGDNGMSRGPYQIGMAYWTDACSHAGVQWDYLSLVWSRPHCEQIMLWYWERYGAQTDEDRIRLHNGGPSKRGTDDYLARVTKGEYDG